MQSILSTHFRPEASGRLIRLNISVVRLASGLPGLVRASPALFHKMGSFAGVRSTTRVRLLGFGLAFRNRFGSDFLSLFHVDFDVVVIVFTAVSRLVALNSIYLLHFT